MKKKIIALLILAAMCVPACVHAEEAETTVEAEKIVETTIEMEDREDREDQEDREDREDREDQEDQEDREDREEREDKEDREDKEKREEKEAERLEKEAERAEKEAERAEKEAEREEKEAERAEKEAAKAEKEAAKIHAEEEVKRLKEERRQAKIEANECLREIKEFFRDADDETRREILAQIAELKAELEEHSIGVFVRGINIDFSKYDNVEPIIENDRTLIPLRAVVEALDSDVSWEAATKTITITKGDISIVMQIGSNIAVVNGVEKELDTAPAITKDRTMVPLRFITEEMQSVIEWDDASRTIIID